MKLIIDIPDEEHQNIVDNVEYIPSHAFTAIRNGIPLPKGHGVLKDVTPLMRGLYEEICIGEVSYNTSAVYKMIDEECSTIIEADKAEREG